jgi:hypothetical protein
MAAANVVCTWEDFIAIIGLYAHTIIKRMFSHSLIENAQFQALKLLLDLSIKPVCIA